MNTYSPAWLALREPADAAARARDLLEPVRRHLAGLPRLEIHDLGCGTGAMGRWLAGRLAGPQHWVLYDRDPGLLAQATASIAGGGLTARARQLDLAALTADDLAGASLVTASALLDVLTGEEVDRLATACVAAGCPALLTLSVTGEVQLSPAEPLDGEIRAAFNAHQRRRTGGRRLLGPDATGAATAAFQRLGAAVHARPSPWRLGPDQAALTVEWLRGWIGAACEQRPELAGPAEPYLRRRLASAAAGELRALISHIDLLAVPPRASRNEP